MSLHEEKRVRETKKMDLFGSVVLMLVLLSLLAGFQLLSDQGLGWLVMSCFIASVLFFVLFIWVEKRAEDQLSHSVCLKILICWCQSDCGIGKWHLNGGRCVYSDVDARCIRFSSWDWWLVLAPISLFWVVGTNVASKMMPNNLFKGCHAWLVGDSCDDDWFIFRSDGIGVWYFVLLMFIFGIGMGMVIVSTTVTAQQVVPKSHLGKQPLLLPWCEPLDKR